jgi:HlyD family secretion protein
MKKLIWVCVAVLVCVAAVGAYYTKTSGGAAVEVTKVSKGEIKQYIEDTADVQSKEEQTVYIEGSGKIIGIKYDVGDSVKKGNLMLTLNKSDLELQLRDANAKVDAARQQIKGTESTYNADKIEIAKAAVEQAKVSYNSALRDYQNAKELSEAGSLSKGEFGKIEDVYKTAQASLNSANSQLADIKRGTPEYVKNTYTSQLEQALVYRDNILMSIDKQQVKSPIDGTVLEKLVDDNSSAIPGTAAFVIGNVKKLKLEADILADDSYKVKIGNEVEISGKALGDVVLTGKVVKIAPNAKTITSTLGVNQKRVPVTIELTDGQGLLKPGYTVDIKIITANKKDTIIVPESSVFDYKEKTCVFTVKNGKTAITEIKKGLENNDFIEVLKGLREGNSILVKPDDTIKEGIKVKPIQSK